MKLTIDRVDYEPKNVAVSIDGYVPIDIKLLEPIGLPPLYWRVGDGKKSLLEMAFLPENGFLSAITLVIMDPDSVHKMENSPVTLFGSRVGLPVVNSKLWKSSGSEDFGYRFIDDFHLGIQAFTSSNTILLIIGRNPQKINWIKCSNAFYIGADDEGNITNLFLDNLSQEEIKSFFEAVG
ncbi:hypothetical protein MXM41_18180 [Leclercia adecarboxylata]|uniref:hypothetical protein n=1 Tax=Leclercia adecarboxylata TaxID=83655 RepID=UPI002DB84C4A|nr:hypothetical protein [Leclercia adecarboxylata]MEB6380840.1 hypothetical protein [Leclercia adecarboxylata]